MSDRVISESPYNYVLFEKSDSWILTLMVGGVVERDVSVRLSASEIEKQKADPEYVKQLVRQLQERPDLLEPRRISPSVWPV